MYLNEAYTTNDILNAIIDFQVLYMPYKVPCNV